MLSHSDSPGSTESPSGLAFFTPEDLQRAEEAGDMDPDANILNLRPDPVQFVALLKSLERADIVSQIFVRLLDAYREAKTDEDVDPTRYDNGFPISSLPRIYAQPSGHLYIFRSL